MALHQGDKHYMRFTHSENGHEITRRIHRMQVQALDGRVYELKGDKLPDSMMTSAGQVYKGEHLAQILLSPGQMSPPPVPSRPWPSLRDVCQIGLGMLTLVFIRFLLALIHAAF